VRDNVISFDPSTSSELEYRQAALTAEVELLQAETQGEQPKNRAKWSCFFRLTPGNVSPELIGIANGVRNHKNYACLSTENIGYTTY